ncbi:alpha/beta fold hydrolase [Leisingera aquimarina]|uniref:alpha/beta fold hydrolase n=1 Tax=Leisingera aquimarina TaxID=476529 RepID=UPI001FE10DBA|nr:alpha/beta hydrolase [Leisingera aquimarina]
MGAKDVSDFKPRAGHRPGPLIPASILQLGQRLVGARRVTDQLRGDMVTEYPKWQALFREHQPPALIVWGKNDHIFPADGAHPYKADLNDVEFHLLDTGHFALEEYGDVIAAEMQDFLGRITK